MQEVVVDPRKVRTKQDYSLKDAKEDFRLWDKVHGREIIKHLEQVSSWEPGKKERERRERLAALEALQVIIFQYHAQKLLKILVCIVD